ncbi:IclR family transcriptional regulator [Mesorhizobium qingshengii]|uniref:IclR family transcriptional regulator n=1 Tax=Mesorhizobium qingshengii TaxID=1165689 RepID=A0ABT4QW37_9HYPH|nr:IclR family transcriptional regulator [Mesorhizobium qingshengii]MCZ8545801.1 IclR family transcriptional regulator [Mesorhizobium qingshengii]
MRLLKSLARGLEALDYLVAQGGPVRLTELASALGVDKSNASHLLQTLVAGGYADQVEGRRYQASAKVATDPSPSLEDIIDVRDRLRPALAALVEETRECAHVAVLVGSRVWYIDQIASPLPLKVDHPIGSLAPLHCTALGKAFLAFGGANPPSKFEQHTPKSIVTQLALNAEVAATRKRGFALDDEEYTLGIRCAAVPIYNTRGQMVAAIGVSGPTARIDDIRFAELGQTVLAQIDKIKPGVLNVL